MWNFTRQMLALASKIGTLAAIAVISGGYVFTALVPLFYFALYRNEGHPPVSRSTRCILLTTAAVIGILALAAILEWVGSLPGNSVLHAGRRPWTIGDTSTLLSLIADVAGILLLYALFRLAGNGVSESGVAVSRLLRLSTKIAVITGGIVAIGCLVGLAATPWVYFYIRDRSLEIGSSDAKWTFSRLAMERTRTALTVASVYVAPFVVWQGNRSRVTIN
jgi:hypothetical protein